jgi:hypothetical protein
MDFVFKIDRSNLNFISNQFSLDSTLNYSIVIILTLLFAFSTPYLLYLQDLADAKHSTACRAALSSARSKRSKLLARIGIFAVRVVVIFLLSLSVSTLDVGLVVSSFVGGVVGYSLTCWFRETRGVHQGRIEGSTLPRSNPPYQSESPEPYPKQSSGQNSPSSAINVQKYPSEYPRQPLP